MAAGVALAVAAGHVTGATQRQRIASAVRHVHRGRAAAVHVHRIHRSEEQHPHAAVRIIGPVAVTVLPPINNHHVEITPIRRKAEERARIRIMNRGIRIERLERVTHDDAVGQDGVIAADRRVDAGKVRAGRSIGEEEGDGLVGGEEHGDEPVVRPTARTKIRRIHDRAGGHEQPVDGAGQSFRTGVVAAGIALIPVGHRGHFHALALDEITDAQGERLSGVRHVVGRARRG